MKEKTLKLSRNGQHFQSVVFRKTYQARGWEVVHHDHGNYLPFQYYTAIEQIPEILKRENIQWEWV